MHLVIHANAGSRIQGRSFEGCCSVAGVYAPLRTHPGGTEVNFLRASQSSVVGTRSGSEIKLTGLGRTRQAENFPTCRSICTPRGECLDFIAFGMLGPISPLQPGLSLYSMDERNQNSCGRSHGLRCISLYSRSRGSPSGCDHPFRLVLRGLRCDLQSGASPTRSIPCTVRWQCFTATSGVPGAHVS